jgi:methylenetetrahydrofolate reductase (NADPH)
VDIDTPIAALFSGKRPLLSLEFFPPKNEAMASDLLSNAEQIASHVLPDFFSITYGAGGGTRDLTYLYAQILRERFGWTAMPHLTCVGHTRDELLAIAESYKRLGIRNLLALRGDPPKGAKDFVPVKDGLAHAGDLVKLIKDELPEFCLGVAGYPEKHPEAMSIDIDITHLKNKVDAGASFVTTQLFFETSAYENFVEKSRAANIRVPIIPGLLPVLSLDQAKKFCGFCGATLPEELIERLAFEPIEKQWEVGVDWTVDMIEELLAAGAPGIHLYILNRSASTLQLLEKLRERGIFKGR